MKHNIPGILLIVFFIVIIGVPVGCYIHSEEQRVSNLYYGKVDIERVFQQYPGTYSFLYKKDGQILNLDISEYRIKSYKIFDDVKIDKQMYIDLVKDRHNSTTVNIHIHSSKDLIYQQVIE